MDDPQLERYMVSTEPERDWVLDSALGYFNDLELARLPSQRISARFALWQDSLIFRPFANYVQRKLFSNSHGYLTKSEDGLVNVPSVKSSGLQSEDQFLCLAAFQHVYSIAVYARRVGKLPSSSDLLWQKYKELMYFCHSDAFSLHAEYEERFRRQRLDKAGPIKYDPRMSPREWKDRVAPRFRELRPISLAYKRKDEPTVTWREDRTIFHRDWIDRKLAGAWQGGYRPYRMG